MAMANLDIIVMVISVVTCVICGVLAATFLLNKCLDKSPR
jgi:uncharacterized protein YneF (UPF0154 family)